MMRKNYLIILAFQFLLNLPFSKPLFASPLEEDRFLTPHSPMNFESSFHFRNSIESTLKIQMDLNQTFRIGIEKNFQDIPFHATDPRIHLGFAKNWKGVKLGNSSPSRLLNEYLLKRVSYVLDTAKTNASSLLWSYSFLSIGVNIGGKKGGVAPYGGYDFKKDQPKKVFTYGKVFFSRAYLENNGDAYSLGYRFSLGKKSQLSVQYRLKSDYEKLYELNGIEFNRVSLLWEGKF